MNFECFSLFPSQLVEILRVCFFFSKYLVEFSGETILAWRFHLMEFINFTSWEYVGMSLALIRRSQSFKLNILQWFKTSKIMLWIIGLEHFKGPWRTDQFNDVRKTQVQRRQVTSASPALILKIRSQMVSVSPSLLEFCPLYCL